MPATADIPYRAIPEKVVIYSVVKTGFVVTLSLGHKKRHDFQFVKLCRIKNSCSIGDPQSAQHTWSEVLTFS